MLRVHIIGGGPAGAAAAISLLRHDPSARVTITEHTAFPRNKVCGEFLSPAATPLVESILGPTALHELGAQRVDTLALEFGNRVCDWPLPAPAWALSRATLDSVLLDLARSSGATVLQPRSVTNVEYRADSVKLQFGDSTTTTADIVIHADGAGRHDLSGPTPIRRGVIGRKCVLHPDAAHRPVGVRMRASRGGYIGMIAVESGHATVALVADARLVRKFDGDGDQLATAMWPRFDPAWRVSPWLSCPVGNSRFIAAGHPRSFRVGNAAAAVEPVGGEGIGLALWSGSRIGELISRATHNSGTITGHQLADIHTTIAREYRTRLRLRRPACRAAAAVLSRPALCRAMWPLLRMPALTIAPWYALTGKQLRQTRPTMACKNNPSDPWPSTSVPS